MPPLKRKRRRSRAVILKEQRRVLTSALEANTTTFGFDFAEDGPPAAAGGRPLRTLTLRLPLPWSINELIRKSFHLRNTRRNLLMRRISRLTPDDWQPLRYYRVDAMIDLVELRDPLELPASLKIEMDALQECNVVVDDGPDFLVVGTIAQRKARPLGVTLTLTELARPERTQ